MDVFRFGSRPEMPAPADWFQGTVTMRPVISAADPPARVRAVTIDFAPGARTAWHTHPAGQTLYILSGEGRVQLWGGKVAAVFPGDTVWIPPGEKHWHGAAPAQAMAHLAVQELHEGRTVDWLEPVTDTDYARAPA